MSKKNTRAKKGDDNVPNFVFNFTGSQPGSPSVGSTSGFGFGGSNPSSPASSSFSFGGGSPVVGSQPFSFGESAASPTAASAFNFNTPSSATSAFGPVKRGASDMKSFSTTDRASTLRRANSEMVGPSTTTQPAAFGAAASTAPFAFGSTLATTNPAASTSLQSTGGSQSSAISFSTPAATTPSAFNFTTPTSTAASASAAPSAFSFSTPTSTAASASTTPSAFMFNAPASTTANTSAAPSAFNFSTPTKSTTPASPFSFGAPAATSAPATTTSTAATSTGTSPFTFPTSTSATSDKPATTTSAPFTFGSTKPAATPAASTSTPSLGGFSFGKPAETPKTTAATPATSSTAASPFSFGAPPATSTAEANKPATTPSLTFGTTKPATPISTAAASSSPFSFSLPTTSSTPSSTTAAITTTTTAATTTAAASVPKFTFGASTGDKDGKPAVTSSPFTFGTPAPSAPGATTATAEPPKPNAFSFAKILDDLAKIAAQPPNQMSVTLITPALAGLQQNQIVQHTNFRIDNIMPSTRFTELPEQAQKELDELEKYVRLEGQRCDYIRNNKIPQHLESMSTAKKNTEILSQQLDALSSTLQVQLESAVSLYDTVKDQLRYANDGSAVLEACKHPGNNARWLFGYSEDDDYFSQLAKQLSGRLEEYKKCIWEIERTAESWSQNKVQSPQDIAHIMRAQNQAFLALSNKVASLHESVNMEKNLYNQYLSMYS